MNRMDAKIDQMLMLLHRLTSFSGEGSVSDQAQSASQS